MEPTGRWLDEGWPDAGCKVVFQLLLKDIICAAEPDYLLSVRFVAVLQHVNAPCCRLQVVDESSQHAGHAAMRDGKAGSGGETHFRVTIVSEAFEGMTTVKRHRQIYQVCSFLVKHNTSYIVWQRFRLAAGSFGAVA